MTIISLADISTAKKIKGFDSLSSSQEASAFHLPILDRPSSFRAGASSASDRLIGTVTLIKRQIPPSLVDLDKITICRCHLLPHLPQLLLFPHLIPKGPYDEK